MIWVVIAGATVVLTVVFWQQIVTWANQRLAGWLGQLFGADVREAFLLIIAGVDRLSVASQRAFTLIGERLIKARILFRRLQGGREHEKVIQAEVKKDGGEIMTIEAAEIVQWHELPDDVREKFIRRQTATVQLELKIKD